MEHDLTKGKIGRTLFLFALPFMISYLLQTLYGLADLFVIGRFNGAESITAVSVGTQVMHMLTVMLVGLSVGSTVMIGRAVGAKNKDAVEKNIGNTFLLFLTVSLVLTFILLFFLDEIVSLMLTPREAVAETVLYLRVCFIGIPFITAYNIISAVFRGLGDSKSPMYFIAVACVLNIALDFLLIGYFGMGAKGAALATVISQSTSVLVAFLSVKLRKTDFSFSFAHLKFDRHIVGDIFKVGAPISLQDWLIQFNFLLILVIANYRGVEAAAAVGIVERLIGIMFLIPSSMSSAVSAMVAQNIGAERHDRARGTLRLALRVTILCGLFFAVSFQFISEPVIALFSGNEKVILFGDQYLRSYVIDCVLAGIHFCFSGFFCAYGLSLASFAHNALSAVLIRVPGAFLASVYFAGTLYPMGLAAPLGSLFSDLFCIVLFLFLSRHRFPQWRREGKTLLQKSA